ncbi:hypothetical protein JH06_5113 [Blastocystis sp. subtype 4]|uniref:hypothetical protein n=1 Tax=Blastocystis sp. subtype 4 TaxID=944170 RepID=UPI0007118A06|nr:hypothetical protein JH06_5113 [Blastocystis sp. subtype 4]KNB41497.1 hypothetical protein JH06_5113 [Blastocystis sp. subtype 4]|eukprot:XP_014524940.1 hypothetical protein JH06_5113 [Blastocystis sp. subtype 4]
MNGEEIKTISTVIILKQVLGLPEGENFILILDDVTMSLVNSVCGQFALLDRVMEHIQSKRDCVSGVTAIYFVEPTERNVGLILDDFMEIKSFVGAESCIDRIIYCGMEDVSGESCLYDKVALRFKGDLSDELAGRILNNQVLQKRLNTRLIHMNYHIEESNVAVTNIPSALKDIWGKNDATGILLRIAKSLVHMCVALGIKPLVHYQCGYPCKDIADLFESEVNLIMLQYIANFQPTLREKGQLLLIDRTIDPLVPLLHPINYQPMAEDLLSIGEGGEFDYRSETSQEIRKVLLDDNDRIWNAYRYEHILTTISSLKEAAKRFLESTQESKNTIQDISNLIKTLPENKQRKELFALHISIAQMCIDQFRERSLTKLIPLEQVIVTGYDEAGSSPNAEKLLKEVESIRLLLIYAIAQGMDVATQQRLFSLSGVGMEYSSILSNLSMLGVKLSQPMEQRLDKKEHLKRVKQMCREGGMIMNRYDSQIRYCLNDLITNALSPSKFEVYDTGTSPLRDIIGVDMSRSREMEWYGKPGKKPVTITGDPIVCYIVGGTCYAEIESLNELAEGIGRNVTIGER